VAIVVRSAAAADWPPRMTRSPRAAITGIRPGEDAERAVRVTSEADVCHLE